MPLSTAAAFLAVGGYDESFTHNEDAELDIRLRNSGGQIWLCSELAISYFPRSSFSALARQYFNHGSGRARTMLKHRRHTESQAIASIGRAWNECAQPGFRPWFRMAVFPARSSPTSAACLTGGVLVGYQKRDPAGCAAGLAAIIMHQSWAAGFIYGALARIRFQSVPRAYSTEAFR